MLSTASGVLTLADVVSHRDRLSKDPEFDPSYSQIADFTQVTRVSLTAGEIHEFAQVGIFSPHARRALIMPNTHLYGLGRMFEILREIEGEKGIRVVRTIEEALAWVSPEGDLR